MEVSNNTLAWLVVTAVVVSIGGTIISLSLLDDNNLTGFATSNTSGNVSVAVASQTSLTFAISNLDFGSGSIDGAYTNCTLYVNATTGSTTSLSAGCVGFGNSTPLTLENNGNTVLNVTLNFTANATFIGGAAVTPEFKFIVYQNESSSCTTLNSTYNATFVDVTGAMVGANSLICTGLHWENNQDTIAIGTYLRIPADASGSKQVTIIAQGTG